MSGIAVVYNADGRPVERPVLERMTPVIAPRGPDGAGHWAEGPIGVGHRLLASTPEALFEESPAISSDGQLVIAADARLDNRGELAEQLGAGLSATDPELILAAYRR